MKLPLNRANSSSLGSHILSGASELSLVQNGIGVDSRLVSLVRLLARQAARDYVNIMTKENQDGPP